jgi:hypothetical protein
MAHERGWLKRTVEREPPVIEQVMQTQQWRSAWWIIIGKKDRQLERVFPKSGEANTQVRVANPHIAPTSRGDERHCGEGWRNWNLPPTRPSRAENCETCARVNKEPIDA